MSPTFFRLLAALILGSIVIHPLPAPAADTSSGAMNKPALHWSWLSEDDKKALLQSIPPAPAPGSPVDQQDLQAVLKLQATRTPQDIAEAWNDKQFRLEMISGPVGASFTKANYPLSFSLLDRVNQDEYYLSSTLKKEYKRPRPFQAHPEVKALFFVDGFSYPSGHSTGAYTLADILGALFPDKKDALLNRAAAVGRSRIVAGAHYPSDVDEGKNLANALVSALLANLAFQKDLAAAKAEVAAKKIP